MLKQMFVVFAFCVYVIFSFIKTSFTNSVEISKLSIELLLAKDIIVANWQYTNYNVLQRPVNSIIRS